MIDPFEQPLDGAETSYAPSLVGSEVARYRNGVSSVPQSASHFMTLLLVITMGLVVSIAYHFATVLFVAAVLAGFGYRRHEILTLAFGGRRYLAGGCIALLVLVVILIPIGLGSWFIVRDGSEALQYLHTVAQSSRVAAFVGELPAGARTVASEAIARMPDDIQQALGLVDLAVGRDAAAYLGNLALSAVLMLIAFFFLLVHGDVFVAWIDSVSPLAPGQTRELLANFRRVSHSVITSSVITAALQAAAALVGFYIARVPNPTFFAAATFVFAFVPAIGAAAVCLVAALLLYATGQTYMALLLAIWAVVVVGLVDNLVKPLIITKGMELHGAVVFFALLGGLATFGAVGLLLGPLILSMFITLLRMHQRELASR